jgi:hypothetical protein
MVDWEEGWCGLEGIFGGRMDGSTMGDPEMGRRKLYILYRVTL